MKKYLSFFRIRFTNTLQYRAAAWAGVCTQFAWGFMNLLMYSAFYKSNPAAFPMGFSQLSSYIWLQQAFLALFAAWFFDNEIFSLIRDGGISYELLRPMDIYNTWFMKNVATRSARAVLRCMPILIVTVLLPAPFNMGPPAGALAFLLFIATLLLGLIVAVSICMLVYITTLHTVSYTGVRMFAAAVIEIMSGAVIPLPFFPDGFRQAAELLPFASINNLPFRIYSGNLSGNEMWFFIGVQIFWIAVLQAAGRLWMKHSMKNIVIQGG